MVQITVSFIFCSPSESLPAAAWNEGEITGCYSVSQQLPPHLSAVFSPICLHSKNDQGHKTQGKRSSGFIVNKWSARFPLRRLAVLQSSESVNRPVSMVILWHLVLPDRSMCRFLSQRSGSVYRSRTVPHGASQDEELLCLGSEFPHLSGKPSSGSMTFLPTDAKFVPVQVLTKRNVSLWTFQQQRAAITHLLL